ncbi:ATP-binding cassette domain-containing protein [Murdochiella massiliensis]|uniref:ATP-binding cassette domain-containing protein n=1 Tax=Murdochiella massiliensis TaxID=1673723 RepID=UPI00082ABAF1|nr:ABC transporter ATP-binding protein [Murdochiella massiliensis]
MLKHMFKYKWYLLVVLVLMIAEPTLNSVMNFLLQRMFNSATPGGSIVELLRLLSAGFLLWMLKRVIIYSNGVIKARFICNAKRDIKHRLFVRMMGLDTANIAEVASSGEYISIFTNDITLLETRFYNQILGLISGLFSLAILGTSFVALNAKLAIPIIGFGIVAMFVPAVFSRKLNEKSLQYSNAISKFTQKVKEYMVAYPTIKNYSIEQAITTRFDRENNHTEDAKFDADCTLTLADCVGQLLAWFMQLMGVGLGLAYVIKGEILVGTVIAAQSFASDLAGPLNNIIVNINSIRSVRNIVKKLEEMSSGGMHEKSLELQDPSVDNMRIGVESEYNRFEVSFDDFNLTLGETNIIDHFSFCFETGKKYLIVGLNGSGKSTLFKALKKWYGSNADNIKINDQPVSKIGNESLSKCVSYLNENVSLFFGSVRDNITLFRKCSPEVFNKAVSDSQIKLDLNRTINDEGRNISSGEQRRIEIARSLLSSVRMIIFDEVVSTLDIETAFEIERMALDFKDKTVVFISHNFSGKLIREYDDILVMQGGKLLTHGTFDELINNCDYFRRICEIKFGNIR